ncbi:MAG: hypothetical protein SCK70_15160 [bacterium]|nr:hypothetical protein [bacterium]
MKNDSDNRRENRHYRGIVYSGIACAGIIYEIFLIDKTRLLIVTLYSVFAVAGFAYFKYFKKSRF